VLSVTDVDRLTLAHKYILYHVLQLLDLLVWLVVLSYLKFGFSVLDFVIHEGRVALLDKKVFVLAV